MNFATISLLAVVVVFGIGALKKNPIHLGILGLAVAYLIGKFAGMKDTAIYGFFPTTMFVRVFGIMFFFAIAQANGAIELLAKKMIAKVGRNAKLMPFFLFYTGVILGSIGINSLAVFLVSTHYKPWTPELELWLRRPLQKRRTFHEKKTYCCCNIRCQRCYLGCSPAARVEESRR